MQLNGWKRIGIVLSVFWILGSGLYQRNADLKKASDFMSFSYKVCTDTQALKNNFDFDECSKKSEKDFDIWMVGSWGNVAVIALAPIPILWLIIYGLIKIYRWIRVGESAERC